MNALAEIADVFNCFHDGGIERAVEEDGNLALTISCEYLAERIDSAFKKFLVTIESPKGLEFRALSKDGGVGEVFKEFEQIFSRELGILDGSVKSEKVHVFCDIYSKNSEPRYGYLVFSCKSLWLADEECRELSFSDLCNLTKGYWDEFGSR